MMKLTKEVRQMLRGAGGEWKAKQIRYINYMLSHEIMRQELHLNLDNQYRLGYDRIIVMNLLETNNFIPFLKSWRDSFYEEALL